MATEHRLYRVTGFDIVGPNTLRVRFDDGTEQVIDFEPVLHGPLYAPLRDTEVFSKVRLVEYAGCLEWPTGADFDPEVLHDWPEYVEDIISRRKEQATTSS